MQVITTAAPITITNNGAIRGDTAYGVFLDSSYGAGSTGAVILQGTGTVWSNENAIYIDTLNAAATVTGLSDITGQSSGIYILSEADSNSVGAVTLGTAASPLASITVTGGKGIYVEQQNGPTSAGDIDMNLGAVTASDNAIEVQNYSSTTHITTTGQIKSTGNSGIYVSPDTGSSTVDGSGTSTVTAANYGIGVETGGSGTIDIKNYASVSGGTQGVRAVANMGAITIADIVSVTGTNDYGIYAQQGANAGAISITGIGSVLAPSALGIYVAQGVNGGTVTLGVDAISSEGNAIEVQNYDSATIINTTGAITSSAGYGIYASPTTGPIAIDGGGTSTVQALQNAIMADGASTSIEVTNYASLTGGNSGIYIPSANGTISIQGNGDIKGLTYYGIQVTTSAGDINIGNTTANGNILGDDEGLTARNTGTGNVNITNAAGKTIQGLYGVTTKTTTGMATLNNAGTIRTGSVTVSTFPTYTTTYDTGAANVPGGATAIHQEDGNGITNNTGSIIGSIVTGGASYVLNNKAGGVWTPGVGGNSFGATSDTVDNAGTINLRTGDTDFDNIESLVNESGGLINLRYGNTATDSLNVIDGILTLKDGNRLAFDVDFGAANGAGDSSSTGKGTADTILASTILHAGVTSIDFGVVGSATVASLVGTSGSLALVNSTLAPDLTDPGLNGLAHAVKSTDYKLLNDPSGAVAFFLVDDAKGGVFLQWAPNVTTSTMGGYMGGAMGSGPAGSAISVAGGGLGGLGGMGAAMPSSGAFGYISDEAAQAFSGSSQACEARQKWRSWGTAEGSGSSFSAGGSAAGANGSLGVERDLEDVVGSGCGKVALGMFTMAGTQTANWATGSTTVNDWGGGVYLRATSDSGFYGTVFGAASSSKANMANNVFAATAAQNSSNVAFGGALGMSFKLDPATLFDTRVFASYGMMTGDGFKDSAGVVVDGSHQNLTTVGVNGALHHAFSATTSAFVQAGLQWTQLDSSMSAFGIGVSGRDQAVFGSAETGVQAELGKGVSASISGYGLVGGDMLTYGAIGRLRLEF